MATPLYGQAFKGWLYLDLPLERATRLIAQLVAAGAGFAHTSEPGPDVRRIYFFSETATSVVKAEKF